VLGGLNALKPVHIDDAIYVRYAQQIVQHPLDPYGFEMFWFQWPENANWVLCPIGVPYWIALGMAMFGQSIWALKLWMTPIALGFTWSMDSLLKQGHVQHRGAMVWMIALSPVVLPGFNLMLDVPVLTLSMISLVMNIRALRSESSMTAVLAGAVCGLAILTKWTAFLFPPVFLLLAWHCRRWLRGLAACVIAGIVVISWESYVAHRYGQSHLIFQVTVGDANRAGAIRDVVVAFVPLIGACMGILLPLLATSLGRKRLAWTSLGVVMISWIISPLISYPSVPFVVIGIVAIVGLCFSAVQQVRQSRGQPHQFIVLLIIAWMVLEIGGYFLLSPFPAMRRMMGLTIASTLLVAMSLRGREDWSSRGIVIATTLCGILLGTGLNTVDYLDARGIKNAATKSVAWAKKQFPQSRIYFAGHWGFQYYAELAGATPLVPDETRLHAGDILLANDVTVGPALILPADKPDRTLRVEDGFPLTALPFHQYRVPLLWQGPTRVNVGVFQIREDRRIYSNRKPEELVPELASRGKYLPDGAIEALIAAMQYGDPPTQLAAAKLLKADGLRAMEKALRHESVAVRMWAIGQHKTDRQITDTIRQLAKDDPDERVRKLASETVGNQ
jgi:hypothetical protein